MELNKELQEEFCGLLGELSPENLSCDGIRSRTEINKTIANIRKRWKLLEKKAGRSVSQDEANEYFYNSYKEFNE
jgi:chromosome condensin MukBEF MukE localization factor